MGVARWDAVIQIDWVLDTLPKLGVLMPRSIIFFGLIQTEVGELPSDEAGYDK
ncbi:hypothetical protein [Snodgrassella sp. CFCC 13594]|uniref:hypothetical protein n=1 Tax=Snodgrassella sp. CFCC 13594 TaxID=1775559 RepID=UPI000B194FE0|nr:hypothetical protein [Snodgrassella sp. CFCC 13594]